MAFKLVKNHSSRTVNHLYLAAKSDFFAPSFRLCVSGVNPTWPTCVQGTIARLTQAKRKM